MGALYVTRIGLKETELIKILSIPQNLWPPLYFGLEKYIINRAGFLRLAHAELEEAVYKRYIQSESQKYGPVHAL